MQKKKSGVKKCLEICAIKGGGRRLMANAILNFHFDYWHPSLRPSQNLNSLGVGKLLSLLLNGQCSYGFCPVDKQHHQPPLCSDIFIARQGRNSYFTNQRAYISEPTSIPKDENFQTKKSANLTNYKPAVLQYWCFQITSIAHTSYLSFFLYMQNFWRIKFTPKFTQ